jgi:phenylpropionate dioxygenase-like ring-hydroxylating dioxygenase large terminal subunit
MLKNLWYVARPSSAVGSEPVHARLLGQDLVLFRGLDGRLACLSDVCIHRGASLSRGAVADGCVECPYHGWRYAPDGRVTKIPAEPGLKIPPCARVDSYPTHEQHGWIWVFVGDLPEAPRPAPPAMPECDDPSIRWISGSWDWNANYHRVVENGLDFAHAPFVHGSAFGDRNNPGIDDFVVEETDSGARSRMVMRVPRNIRGLWSFLKAAMSDKDSVKRNLKIFHQDTVVLEKIRPEQVPDSWREELTVRTDALQVSYRRRVRALESRGWKVDTARIDAEFRGRRACVLPSPARADANEPFVRPTVPFTGPEDEPARSVAGSAGAAATGSAGAGAGAIA